MQNLLQRIIRNLRPSTYRIRISKLRYPKAERKVIHAKINGYSLLVFANEDVGRLIHFCGRYEHAETEYLRKMIRSDAICVDVGANVGYFTMLMAQAAQTGRVHAFEPIGLVASLLRANVELNGFTNVRVNQCAVGDRSGFVSFAQSADSAYSSIHDTGRKPLESTNSLPVTTLDEYLDREGIGKVDVLKADVEGAEAMVIAGASKLLGDESRRPGIVMLELQDMNFRAFGSSVSAVVDRMQSFGYSPFVVNEAGHMLAFGDELKDRYYNVIFIPVLRGR